MLYRIMHPELVGCSLTTFLDRIKFDIIYTHLLVIAEEYNKSLKLWRILNHYGVGDVSDSDVQQQVKCNLVEHGTSDRNKSARYFSYDQEIGDENASVYCYKCQKRITAFWYIYKYQKDHCGMQLGEIFKYIYEVFGVDFPYHVVLDHDPEAYLTFENENRVTQDSIIDRALGLRGMKKDLEAFEFRAAVVALYRSVTKSTNR